MGPADGTGLYSLALFKGWPREALASVYSLSGLEEDRTACGAFFRMYPRGTASVADWRGRVGAYVLGRSESLDGYVSFRMTQRLRRWLDDFGPQVVYSHLGSLSMTRLASRVAMDWEIPLILHINDDYISDWPVTGHPGRSVWPGVKLLNIMNKAAFNRALQVASKRYVVSPSMRDEYRRRYGGQFEVINKGADLAEWEGAVPSNRQAGSSGFRIYYGGTISENKNRASIQEVASAVHMLRAEGLDVQLHIATSSLDERTAAWIQNYQGVDVVPYVTREKLPDVIKRYSLLLLPFSFDSGCIRYIRYSWPSKMPEYMASGVPILMYGPAQAGFVEYAKSERWAHVIEAQDPSAVTRTLRRMIADNAFLIQYVDNARELARAHHNMFNIRESFQSAVAEVAEQGSRAGGA